MSFFFLTAWNWHEIINKDSNSKRNMSLYCKNSNWWNLVDRMHTSSTEIRIHFHRGLNYSIIWHSQTREDIKIQSTASSIKTQVSRFLANLVITYAAGSDTCRGGEGVTSIGPLHFEIWHIYTERTNVVPTSYVWNTRDLKTYGSGHASFMCAVRILPWLVLAVWEQLLWLTFTFKFSWAST